MSIALPLLDVRSLSVSYGNIEAVRGVSFQVYPGQMTAIVGESGSGKSTTASAILGLVQGTVLGEVLFDGRLLTDFSPEQWLKYRGKRIALIPQDPHNSFNPTKTIGQSLEEGLKIHGVEADILGLLARVGIDNPAKRAAQYPHELSGGMKQRCLIAAAVALQPSLIIADEPTSALDVTVQKKVLDLLDELRQETGAAIIFITHDLAVAADRADHIVVMQKGELKEEGVAAQVLNEPKDPYTAKLVADAPSLSNTEFRPLAKEKSVLLSVKNLSRVFGDYAAVNDVSFDVLAGTTHAIVGESGSGKTTTGRIILGFEQATSGTVELHCPKHGNVPLPDPSHIQMVYQNPLSSLDPRLSIADQIAAPLKYLTDLNKKDIKEKVDHFLDRVSLDPALARRKPRELSGGQRQRVAIARALIIEPQLVVLDEAVSALDVTVQSQILDLLRDLQEELGITYIFISHDLAVVKLIADTVSVMRRGELVENGTVAEIYEYPRSDYTRTLLDSIPGRAYLSGELNIGL